MRSSRPKPIHLLCGKPMVGYVIDSLGLLDVERTVVVVGHGADLVTKKLHEAEFESRVEFVEQRVQRGTGDAVSVGLTAFDDTLDEDDDHDDLLVLPGDTPLLRPETMRALVEHHRSGRAACTLLTARLDDPTGYGRVIRGREDKVLRIVEHSDADPDELSVNEVCTSIYVFRRGVLAPALRRLSPENAQREYYLTDVVSVLAEAGYRVEALVAEDPNETRGVNDRVQLAAAEAELRRRTNLRWQQLGVTMLDPERTYIDTTVQLGTDVTLFPGCILQGRTVVGDGSEIGPDTRLVDCAVGSTAVVQSSLGQMAEVGDDAVVGPFAVLEPGSVVQPGEVTGPFSHRSG